MMSAIIKAILNDCFVTLYIIISNDNPAMVNKMPAMAKSDKVQFTASVKYMAINGTNNNVMIVPKIK